MTRRALVAACLGLISGAVAATAQEGTAAGADPATVAWLAGCWQTEAGASTTEEQWMAPAGGLMVGMSRTVREGRARGWEFLLIRSMEGRLVYRAYPSGQSPTSFPAASAGEEEVVFVNAEHDFPQKIRYRRHAPDRIVASVFGEADAETPAFELDYRRVPCAEERR